ncbi:MAG TPA: hypothetical protein P5049_05520 [Methanothrix sp.]|nr:hypothetical protein [Methanothrix sp.]
MASAGPNCEPCSDSSCTVTYDCYGKHLCGTGTTSNNITFDFDQSVQGSGYFMTYRYIQLDSPDTNAKGPMYKDYAHGSGTIDNEITICAEEIDYSRPVGCFRECEAYSCISAREDNSMVYSPMAMTYGNGYYARNPIVYNSLLKEKTVIKNYKPATMMHHQVEYAKAIDKEIDVIVKDKRYIYEDPVYQGVGYTSMKINEDITDGMVDIGVLQGEPNSMDPNSTYTGKRATSAWVNPMIEIDEHYVGTFHIEKNMSIDVPYKKESAPKDWLTCCILGCGDPCDYGPYYNPCNYDCMGMTMSNATKSTAGAIYSDIYNDIPATTGGCCGN